jgi:tetratricopeptide (TPR) repeat protein
MSARSPVVELAAVEPAIPEHQLLRPIASGSYGEVWLARSAVGTFRAVKIVRRDRFDRIEDFEREFRGLQKFEPVSRTHEALVDILQIGKQDDWFYYVMELADDASADPGAPSTNGITQKPAVAAPEAYKPQTLRQLIRHRSFLPANQVIELGCRLASALARLHGQGLVHRDVKPSNILFVNGQAKLADAGLVAAVEEARSLVGTPGYIPPEGAGTPQADIYSLGKVLYEAAFGKDRQVFPQLPADVATRPEHIKLLELNEVIVKACAQDPRERYATISDLLAELEALQGGRSIRTKRRLEQYWFLLKRTGVAAGLLGLLVAALMLAGRWRGDTDFQSSISEVNTLVEEGNVAVLSETPERVNVALAKFKKAVELDPKFVPAQFGVFRAYEKQADSPERMVNIRTVGRRLMELDPSLAESHLVSAYIKWCERRYREALDEARLATKSPSCSKVARARAHQVLGYCLLMTDHPSEAFKETQLAKQFLPTEPGIQQQLGHPFFVRGRFKEALEYYQESIALEPRHSSGYYLIGRAYEGLGDFAKAIDAHLHEAALAGTDDADTKRRFEALRLAALNGGAQGYHLKALEFAFAAPEPDSYTVAACYAHLRETEKAYEWLARAERDHSIGDELMFDPCWDHTDERFKAVATRVGLMW